MIIADAMLCLFQLLDSPDQRKDALAAVERQVITSFDETKSYEMLRSLVERFLANRTTCTPIQILQLIQDCDAWYEPFGVTIWSEERPLELELDLDRLENTGRLNTSSLEYSVIPRFSRLGRGYNRLLEDCAFENEVDWMNSVLHFLTVLPKTIAVHHPDHGSHPSSPQRQISLLFRRLQGDSVRRLLLQDESKAIRVACAPVLFKKEQLALKFSRREDGSFEYAVIPQVEQQSINAVVTALNRECVNIAMLPETVIQEEDLPDLKAAIQNQGATSSLVLVVVGVSGLSDHRRTNTVVLIDGQGVEIGRHTKLLRWNLRVEERTRYGIEVEGLKNEEFLFENMDPGNSIEIIDIPGIGRVMVLICADLIAQIPTDWIRKHLYLDWTFAPIMDSSIEERRWMSIAARRGANFSSGRMLVATSLALQDYYESKNGTPRVQAGVLFLVDGAEENSPECLIRMTCESKENIVVEDWAPTSWANG